MDDIKIQNIREKLNKEKLNKEKTKEMVRNI